MIIAVFCLVFFFFLVSTHIFSCVADESGVYVIISAHKGGGGSLYLAFIFFLLVQCMIQVVISFLLNINQQSRQDQTAVSRCFQS